ncbi:hypothetical protein JIN85_05970 [Luteolibacter pohnpeiensis]|uniref:Uncharacterized protein n=1 Tax=Luteolibacter pohnpeiensis TaxID=454153 RepID=A0A934S946_9BACT|nr:hypothetical protein [Luteolibacter pohnpeiensis]MBK1881952.1 hypothetical protein [Luteolibacter pohnpeiensis]
MKTHITIIVSFMLISLATLFGAPPESEVQNEKPTYEQLAEDFYTHVSSPGALTLSINDQVTLDEAIRKLKISEKRISHLAKEFQKLPLPSDAARKAVNKMMEEKEAKSQKEIGERFTQHLQQMPEGLRNIWTPQLREFYKNLDKNKGVFDKYFGSPE